MLQKFLVFCFCLALIPFSACVFAEESITITTYYPSPYGSYSSLYVANNVGIGTSNPGVDLSIRKSSPILSLTPSATTGQSIMQWFTYDSDGNGVFDSGDKGWHVTGRGDNATWGSERNDLIFWKYDSAWTNVLDLDSSGNVGIGTAGPTTTLDVNGGIKSTKWKVTQLFDSRAGSLPLTSSSFNTGGGTLLIFASGTGWATGGQQIGMSITVDSTVRGYAKSFTNEGLSHKAFSCNALVVTGIAAGSHTITLSSWNSTQTDGNDFFNVTVLELPF